MALPFLPGNSFNLDVGKTKYHLSHHFDFCNDTALNVGECKPGIGGECRPGQRRPVLTSKFPKGEGSHLPAWVAFDRQVLSFDAYFQEGVVESREEQYRIRKVKIYFYLEDDSTQVIEPRFYNGGIAQGPIIKRHRIPRPQPHEEENYTVEDFNVGNELNFYGKVFKITDCDEFTRNFLKKLGVRVGPPTVAPTDPYMNYRKSIEDSMQPRRPYEKVDTLKQFLDHDRHVLRFYCYWDDTENMYGDQRQMVLHYFLADDTLEIREVLPPNAGRDTSSVFMRKGKLPKNVDQLQLPGVLTDRTVLNVFGPMGQGSRYILDSLKTGSVKIEYYKDSDLTIGTAINVWGRKFVLCDCDDFTKEYYRNKYGITEFTPVTFDPQKGEQVQKMIPPYNGFGSEEDSLCSCQGLMPQPPKRDFIKFMEKDRRGLESNVLRFMARLDTHKPIDKDRRFIISYFLSDDTLLVFEPPIRNSGIVGGKFLERGRVKKPGQERFAVVMSEYYTAPDLYVGAKVDFNTHKFILIDADEYALRYMETRPLEFPKSNLQTILQKVQQRLADFKEDVRCFFASVDPKGTGIATYAQLRDLLQHYRFVKKYGIMNPRYGDCLDELDGTLAEQEIMTLARHFSASPPPPFTDMCKLRGVAQEHLRKWNYEGFTSLHESLAHQDKTKTGFLNKDVIRTTFLSHHVPLPEDMLKKLLDLASANEYGQVDYVEFIKLINWRDACATPVPYQSDSQDKEWKGTVAKNEVTLVNYFAILEALYGDPVCDPKEPCDPRPDCDPDRVCEPQPVWDNKPIIDPMADCDPKPVCKGQHVTWGDQVETVNSNLYKDKTLMEDKNYMRDMKAKWDCKTKPTHTPEDKGFY